MTKLAVAVDTADLSRARSLAQQLGNSCDYLKLGLQFYLAHGQAGVAAVRQESAAGLFLDLKLHDIPATVAGAAGSLAPLEPAILTVHAAGGADMISAAVTALPTTQIAAVTVLTSLSGSDLAQLVAEDANTLVPRWVGVAAAAGAQAIVCSPLELSALRPNFPDMQLITPGIRPQGSDLNDQARVLAPRQASELGSDLIVVGRPITGAVDPAAVAQAIKADLS